MGEKNEASYNDEINLYSFYLVIKKKFRLILTIFVLSVTGTAVTSLFLSPVYRSSFVVKVYSVQDKTPILSSSEVDKLLSELDNLRKEKRYDELSKKLDIKVEIAQNIAKLSTATIRDSKDLTEIIVDAYNTELVNILRNALLRYLNQQQYVNDRITLWKESNLHLKGEIEARINEIEAFKNVIITQIKNERARYLGFNPLQLEEEIINIKQKAVELENTVKLLKGFEVTVEPNKPQIPVKPKLALNILISGIVSIFSSFFLALFIEWFEKHKNSSLKQD
jgi:capsular polysaccharide biosynthesis protein